MKLARECAEIVIITREDRDATAEYLGYPKEHFEPDGNMELDLIRAFARHRQATEARAQGLVEALTASALRFREYEASHAAKGNLDGDAKARRNCEMAEQCEQALATWRRT